MAQQMTPVDPRSIPIGKPLRDPVYARDGTLLLAKGQIVPNAQSLERIKGNGFFRPSFLETRLMAELPRLDENTRPELLHPNAPPEPEKPRPVVGVVGKKAKRTISSSRVLRVTAAGGTESFNVVLIGGLEGKSLVISAPERDGKLVFVKEGQAWDIRGFSGQEVFTFQLEVTKVAFSPFPYVHLSWPTANAVTRAPVRSTRRAVCNLPCVAKVPITRHSLGKATTELEDLHGMLLDLSDSGARMGLGRRLPPEVERFELAFRVKVGERIRLIKVDAKVARELEPAGDHEYVYGLSFTAPDEETWFAMHAYVLQQIVLELEVPIYAVDD
jgi:c-di-GMP-binding flagellar brake protein YcgR